LTLPHRKLMEMDELWNLPALRLVEPPDLCWRARTLSSAWWWAAQRKWMACQPSAKPKEGQNL